MRRLLQEWRVLGKYYPDTIWTICISDSSAIGDVNLHRHNLPCRYRYVDSNTLRNHPARLQQVGQSSDVTRWRRYATCTENVSWRCVRHVSMELSREYRHTSMSWRTVQDSLHPRCRSRCHRYPVVRRKPVTNGNYSLLFVRDEGIYMKISFHR